MKVLKGIWSTISFVLLLIITVFYLVVSSIFSLPLMPESRLGRLISKLIPLQVISRVQSFTTNIHRKIAGVFERKKGVTISRVDLMEFSFKTIWMKRSRSLVTMGGIAFGVGFIVFLVSLGFGLQNVIISRAVRLNELRQADVNPGLAEELHLTDSTIAKFEGIDNVETVYPVISSVGKIKYQQSSFDVAIYGVTSEYLNESALLPQTGEIFQNNALSLELPDDSTGTVSGVDDNVVLGASNSGTLDLIEIDQADLPTEEPPQQEVEISGSSAREIVVNNAFLEVMGLGQAQSIGEKVNVQIVVVGELLDTSEETLTSVPQDYTIVGVIDDNTVPVAYIPFIDMRSLGISKYSQLRITVNQQDNLSNVRAAVESQGYSTTSVADTVSQIESFFRNLRIVLGALGLVALGVAALGMFNTLTVSLLERTHEVGLLKALGMNSSEVRELFLSESMIMGFFGGMAGLLVGILSGQALSLILSTISVAQGGEPIRIASTPLYFIALIILLSLMIGVVTGWYPARRATKIPALNALRYE